MSQVKLEANVREKTGKGVARKLRRAGRVPGVLYGHHMEQPILFDVDLKELESILYSAGRTAVINLNLKGGNGSGNQTAMLADYQRDVFGTCVTHVDLKQVRMDEMVTASVPIALVGNSVGVKGGGVVEQLLREIQIEALPMDVPENLEVDITDLDMGHHMTVADLQLPSKVTLLNADPTDTVVTVHAPRAVTLAAEAEAETAGAQA